MDFFDRARKMLQGSALTAPAKKPERNEPCWCGSGRKYKKCHLPEDDAKAAARACSPNCGPT